ncbi:aldolase/citrate lyase family protein [Francisella sp. 19X1-34]|uniref:HpcH/HpaI aldolase family protein n=1 Tax=Francisella sp. 19X1-34 TaxID=3087177 RepID=UPI002E343293|nr:aldolase/citrate lyase family protein [Francisella sp. 19X1-34]MED7789616.1 aldolase/citrate lyase family protein [Francisella sp. 19X1-34]
MNITHTNFKKALNSGEIILGTFVKTPSLMLNEVLSQTSLEAFCLDAEHSPFDRKDLDMAIFAFRSRNKPSLVRVPSKQDHHILNALDCGATGVIIPHVDSAEVAKKVIKATKYCTGGRGYAGSSRNAEYGGLNIFQNLENNREITTVIAQIEDKQALDNIKEIAQVDGLDCLFIGIMDLTISLGANSPKDDQVQKAIEHICEVARKAGKRLGIFLPNTQDLNYWFNKGVTLFLLSSEHSLLKQACAAMVEDARDSLRNRV